MWNQIFEVTEILKNSFAQRKVWSDTPSTCAVYALFMKEGNNDIIGISTAVNSWANAALRIPSIPFAPKNRVQVKQRTYFPLVSVMEMAIFGKLSWPNLTFLTHHLAYYVPLT